MVGYALSPCEQRERRAAGMLEAAGLPGEPSDHLWLARRLHRCLAEVAPEGEEALEQMEALLISGLLLEMGQDPSRVPQLRGCCFPDTWLQAVPPLLRSGFPVPAWRLVEASVLSTEGRAVDGRWCWRIAGNALQPVRHEWYELGEQVSVHTLSRALMPLSCEEEAGIRVRIAGLPFREARHWATALREHLDRWSPRHWIHVTAG